MGFFQRVLDAMNGTLPAAEPPSKPAVIVTQAPRLRSVPNPKPTPKPTPKVVASPDQIVRGELAQLPKNFRWRDGEDVGGHRRWLQAYKEAFFDLPRLEEPDPDLVVGIHEQPGTGHAHIVFRIKGSGIPRFARCNTKQSRDEVDTDRKWSDIELLSGREFFANEKK